VRYVVKAVGDLDPELASSLLAASGETVEEDASVMTADVAFSRGPAAVGIERPLKCEPLVRIPYSDDPKEWLVNEYDVQALSIGAGLLGVGGGGSVYLSYLRVMDNLKAKKRVVIKKVEAYAQITI
jgi:hypothetical protein